MKLLNKTLSLCEHCYRHVEAEKYIKDDSIWLHKHCIAHGDSWHLVEPDADFYVNYNYRRQQPTNYFIEVTNKCNLACPHCYQMPDNSSTDPTISSIIEKISTWPDNGIAVSLVGAEPTVRKDLPVLIEKIKKMDRKERPIMLLTNGVNLADEEYAKEFKDFTNLYWTFGLNHKDYQGQKVRDKQIQGIENCFKHNLPVKNISYTLLDLTQLEDCIKEIIDFGNKINSFYRIRCGADIGRTPGGDQIYLSQLLKNTIDICNNLNIKLTHHPEHGNRAHYAISMNGIMTKIIQWPDVKTLDLSEVQTESIGDMLPNKPPSPLVHQVILRDGFINKKLPMLDTIPDEWNNNYGLI